MIWNFWRYLNHRTVIYIVMWKYRICWLCPSCTVRYFTRISDSLPFSFTFQWLWSLFQRLSWTMSENYVLLSHSYHINSHPFSRSHLILDSFSFNNPLVNVVVFNLFAPFGVSLFFALLMLRYGMTINTCVRLGLCVVIESMSCGCRKAKKKQQRERESPHYLYSEWSTRCRSIRQWLMKCMR